MTLAAGLWQDDSGRTPPGMGHFIHRCRGLCPIDAMRAGPNPAARRSRARDPSEGRGPGASLDRGHLRLGRGSAPLLGCHVSATAACPWGGVEAAERCALWCHEPPPLRGQREVVKRQPAGTGRRSPARFACSRAGVRSSEWLLHLHMSISATLACPWGGAETVEQYTLWCHEPPRSGVSVRRQTASPSGRAGARPRASLVRGRWCAVRRGCGFV